MDFLVFRTMQWNELKDILMFREIITEGVFSHKSGSRERGSTWQNVSTSLNAFEGFCLSGRAVRDRVTYLMKKFSAKNNAEINATGIGGEEPTEYEILLQDLLDLSNDSDARQETINEKRKATVDDEKRKALDIREIAMENLKETRERNLCNEGPTEKKARRSGYDTLSFLRDKIELERDLHERELNIKKDERSEFQDMILRQQQQSNDVLKVFAQQAQTQSQQQNLMQQQMQSLMTQQQQQLQVLVQLVAGKK